MLLKSGDVRFFSRPKFVRTIFVSMELGICALLQLQQKLLRKMHQNSRVVVVFAGSVERDIIAGTSGVHAHAGARTVSTPCNIDYTVFNRGNRTANITRSIVTTATATSSSTTITSSSDNKTIASADSKRRWCAVDELIGSSCPSPFASLGNDSVSPLLQQFCSNNYPPLSSLTSSTPAANATPNLSPCESYIARSILSNPIIVKWWYAEEELLTPLLQQTSVVSCSSRNWDLGTYYQRGSACTGGVRQLTNSSECGRTTHQPAVAPTNCWL